jgi:hypothetical protein
MRDMPIGDGDPLAMVEDGSTGQSSAPGPVRVSGGVDLLPPTSSAADVFRLPIRQLSLAPRYVGAEV